MAYHFRDPLLRPIRETAVELGDLNETSTKTIKLHPKSKELIEFLREALARVPFLYGVHLHQILRFTEAMEHCRLLPREVAVREGSTIDYLYVVHTGRVLVQSLNTKRMLGPGDAFGQEALDTGGRADFTAIGQGSAELYRLHRQVFKLMQMEYGTRLRMTIWSVIEQNRKAKGPSAFQGVVTQAMTRHKDIKSLSESSYDGYESLAREFADVPAAVTQSSSVAILGKGQFGEVHLIVHKPTRKAYALKIQDSAGMNGRTPLRTLIDREIACMREGASPFLMRFYGEYVDAQKKSYMLLEHLGGGSLEDLMADHRNSGAMSLHTVRFYFACMCAAFDALHSAAWMHRDLSAKNVMISRRGYCKVIDVGLAKRVSESEHTYTSCGTPLYLAPEIIHKTGYGHKAEVWALGVLLFQITSGRFPFMPPKDSTATGAARKMELYQAIIKSQPAMSDPCFTQTGALGQATKELIERMLDKRPSERINIPNIFKSSFFEGFDFPALHAQTMPPPFVPPRDSRLPDPR